MRKIVVITLLFIHTICFKTVGQIADDIMVGTYVDFVKSDYVNFLEKTQIGAELNYFATKSVTATVGFDYWTNGGVSFIIGGRWYPVDAAFFRLRGLVGENDLSIGGGFAKPINKNLKFEAIADFYFHVDFAIRGGLVYVFKR